NTHLTFCRIRPCKKNLQKSSDAFSHFTNMQLGLSNIVKTPIISKATSGFSRKSVFLLGEERVMYPVRSDIYNHLTGTINKN
ncbi:MAG: hypothetical protein IJO60_12645, partial [Agathobacter sp.]|nr:hypothetical protein [Agathobacter sp.]